MNMMAVYCGAHEGDHPIYRQSAEALGSWLVKKGWGMVYGGSRAGLMGIMADAVLSEGGKVIGVMPEFLKTEEHVYPDLTEFYTVEDMDERKQLMMKLAQVCLALPGGPGTLEEISEAISWGRVGKNQNLTVFYNIHHYYDDMKHFFDKMAAEAFLSQEDRDKVHFVETLEELTSLIEEFLNK